MTKRLKGIGLNAGRILLKICLGVFTKIAISVLANAAMKFIGL